MSRFPKLYLAAPLFNNAERLQNALLSEILEPYFKIYLPQRDGALVPDLIATGMDVKAVWKKIFSDDLEAIKQCDVLLIILNGRTIDEGAAFELGVAWNMGKTCIGFKDDFRSLVKGGDNPMIEGALTKICHSVSELKDWAIGLGVIES